MHELFGELKKLPCVYCTYCNCYATKCLDRGKKFSDLEPCDEMNPNIESISFGIKDYFEFYKKNKSS